MGDTRARASYVDNRSCATCATQHPKSPNKPRGASNSRRAASARKARYRSNLRQGVMVIGVPITNEIIERLLDTNYLPLAKSEDRSAIAVAIAEMLNDASKHERPRHE
jgi:hypothetical protein